MAESFSRPKVLSARFAATSTWQFSQSSPIRDEIGRWFLERVGEGTHPGGSELDSYAARLSAVSNAAYVDVDFDAISHALTLTAVWSPFSTGGDPGIEASGRATGKSRPDDRVEVGTLQVQHSDEPEELSLGGFLTVIGEDDRPGTFIILTRGSMY